MKFRVEVICVNDEGTEQRHDVMEMERQELAMETLGLSLAEGKAILRGVQDFVASQQISEDLQRRRSCPNCGQRYHSKEAGTSTVETVFGPVAVPNPRWERCPCQTEGPKTFRPTATWLKGRTSPERLYLETKWGSLIPYEKVADLLKEVLPVSESTNHETVREHLQAVAERMEAELGEERQPDPVKPEEDPELPLPDGPMTVGIDGGYVRAAHKEGCFEVIAGRSVVAFRRREEDAVPPPKCFGFVQTYDPKPRRRLWELMKSQGMQENQQVVFLSDGGEDIRQVREYLHPNSEHVIDWFHITMRLTVLQQQTKALRGSAARDRGRSLETDGEHQAPTVARKCGRGPRAADQPAHGPRADSGPLRTGRKTGGGGWRSSRLTFATIRNPSRTTASATGRAKRSAPPSSNRRSIRWSVGGSSRNNRCIGRYAGRTCFCKPGPRS